MRHLDLVRGQCEQPAEIELALWFHDAVYVPGAADNERRSADWAVHELESAGASQHLSASIRSLILVTQHDAVPTTPDEQVIADIDLAILGASGERFLEYEAQVRKEYAWVPDSVFGRERAKLLRGFLARPSIYSTEFFRERLEPQARQNIAASLARLGTIATG
jgi:predicted metal-dependent HD superfamily phosphohydrolase